MIREEKPFVVALQETKMSAADFLLVDRKLPMSEGESLVVFKEGMSGSPMHQQYVCNAKEEPAESVIAQILDGWQGSLVSQSRPTRWQGNRFLDCWNLIFYPSISSS